MAFKHSFRTLFPVALMLVLGPVFNGCVALALVGIGSAGAYAISKDSIEGEVKNNRDAVYKASVAVVKSKGMIKSEDQGSGKIEGVVGNGVTVKIALFQGAPKMVKIKVEARKNLLPNIEVAQEVYTAILKKIA